MSENESVSRELLEELGVNADMIHELCLSNVMVLVGKNYRVMTSDLKRLALVLKTIGDSADVMNDLLITAGALPRSERARLALKTKEKSEDEHTT